MRELATPAAVAAASGNDTMCVWAAQNRPGFRAWEHAGAVAVACPDLFRRDRLVLHGPHESAVRLARAVLPAAGGTFRLLGETALISAVVAGMPCLTESAEFGWMETAATTGFPYGDAGWLDASEWREAGHLIDEAFPESYARPGLPGVHRWAGLRDQNGRLTAVAADAWSVPGAGFLSGLVVRPDARGTGAGRLICTYLVDALVADYGRAALMVDDWNAPATAIYRRLGMQRRTIRTAKNTRMP